MGRKQPFNWGFKVHIHTYTRTHTYTGGRMSTPADVRKAANETGTKTKLEQFAGAEIFFC